MVVAKIIVSGNMIGAKKILILGARGMLGTDLGIVFAQLNPVLWNKNDLDITDRKAVLDKIATLAPDIIINSAAYTNVDGAESNRDLADRINHQAVAFLAEAAKKIGAILVQISTEQVFSGNNKNGYNEDDTPHPINFYGWTKWQGEKVLIESDADFYIVRTSWLFGRAKQRGKPRGVNFIETILQKASSNHPLKVVNDQFGHPTYTYDLAMGIFHLLDKYPLGVYHLVNNGVASWYDLASYVLQISGNNAKIEPCSSSDFATIAKRPHYGILNSTKFPYLRDWQAAVKEYLLNK